MGTGSPTMNLWEYRPFQAKLSSLVKSSIICVLTLFSDDNFSFLGVKLAG